MKNQKGFFLVEFLVAMILVALAGAGLFTGFTQAVKAEKRIREKFQILDPIRLLNLRIDEDLRNMIVLREKPFTGKRNEIQFPAVLKEESRPVLIRYFLRNGSLVRAEEKEEKVLVKNLKNLEFQFPYVDAEEKRIFETFWLDDPYQGLPRGVKMTLTVEGVEPVTKMISIPQGKLGHVEA